MDSSNNFAGASTSTADSQNEVAEDKMITSVYTSVKEVHRCPYKDCNFSSTWKASLNNHIKTHTDERPWQCAFCNKHFRLKHHLKHHILTHSQNKPFKCNLCDYRSNDVQSLQRHKVNKHKFPVKRKTVSKALSLPTMISLSSQSQLNATSSQLLNNILPKSQKTALDMSLSDPFTHSQLLSVANSQQSTPVLPSNSLSSISDALMKRQQYLLSSNTENKSNSESASVFLPQPISNSEGDSIANLDNDHDTNNDQHSTISVQSVYTREASKNSLDLKPTFWSVSTSNSIKSADANRNGRISVESEHLRSPSLNHKRYSDSFSEGFALFEPASDNMHSLSSGSQDKHPKSQRMSIGSEADSSLWECSHCAIVFPDNIMYGLHMGCHAVGSPFQCNVCGKKCSDRHDFMFHFTIGKHVFER